MNFLDDLKTWHWVIIGVLAGLLVGTGLTLNPPRADHVLRPPISFDQFIASVQQSTSGDLAIRNITVGPIENHQQLVIGEYLDEEKFRPFALYIDVPFSASDVHVTSVQEYLHAAAELNHGLTYSLAWWQADWFTFTVCGLGGLILIGGIWPQMLHVLRGGRPQADTNNYDLNRFHHEQSASHPKVSEDPSAALARHVENMQQQVPESNPMPAPQSTSPPATATVRPLSAGPLSVSTPTQEEEDKKYAGEFYPVEKPHKSKDDAFSLVELLVVIGIVTILISLLLPAIQRARAVANVTACASNMRQMGIALQIYLNENKGVTFWRGENINTDGMDWYAYGGRETGNANRALNDYFNTPPRPLNHYLHNQLAIFHCPCDTLAPWTYDTTFSNYPAPTQFDWVGTSYNFNANGYPLRDPPRQDQGLDGVPFTTLRNTSQTIVFYEADLYYGYDWHYSHKGNLAFADNHVDFVPLPPQFGQIQWNP
jgi:prepilin-type N-terminal cleavage/methylation domain-containing protein